MTDEKDDVWEINDNTLEETQDAQEEAAEPAQAIEPSTDELKAQIEDLKDKYLRALAEMDNMKKRQQRQYADVLKYGKEAVLKDILLVYDAIEKSIASALGVFPDDDNFIKGLRMTEKLMLETLKKHGAEPIQTVNVAFNPHFHEAMAQVMRTDIEPGMVADEIEKGFLLNERVLRPAKVTVVS